MELTGVMIGSANAADLVGYYTELFGEPGFRDEHFAGWQFGASWVVVGNHDQVAGKNAHPPRVMWNLETADVRGDFARLRDRGAIVVQEPYTPGGPETHEGPEMLIATLADPDDNYFQLMSPMGP